MRAFTTFCLYLVVLSLSLMIAQSLFAKEQGAVVTGEAEQLIGFVEESGCQFNRNGRWYDSKEAAKHIAKKYRYVKKRGKITKAEDFITYAATKSSMSGKTYTVQCGDGELLQCSDWLTKELTRLRGEK